MTETVTYSIGERVANVELNRPDVLNALDYETCEQLVEVFSTLAENEQIDIVQFSGRGDAFCSGFDLNELRDDVGGLTYDHYLRHANGMEDLQQFSRILRDAEFILVAKVQGFAVGAGCELALLADICITDSATEFGFPETHVGLSITNAGTNLLPRNIGLPKAKLMALTGERISGEKAEKIGLVSDCVAPEELDNRMNEIIDTLLGRAPTALTYTNKLLNVGAESTFDDSLERELVAGQHLLRKIEYQNAMADFFGVE